MIMFFGIVTIISGIILFFLNFSTDRKRKTGIGGFIIEIAGLLILTGSKQNLIYGILLVIIGIVVSIIINKYNRRQLNEEIEKKKQEEQAQIEQEKIEKRHNQALSIYNKCIQKNIVEFTSKSNKEALRVIAGSYGVDDIELAQTLFEEGKKVIEEQNRQQELEKIEIYRAKEIEEYNKEKELTVIKGKTKYTAHLEKDIEYGKKAIELSYQAEKIGLSNMNARAQKSDWAILGGMANGLAGPAAGMATAIDIQNKNLKAEENARKVREDGTRIYNNAKDIQRNLPAALVLEQSVVDNINEKLYDDKNIEEKIKLIEFGEFKLKATKGLNIEAKAKIKVDSKIKLLDSDAILDGSLRFVIKNHNDEEIGDGYFSAPGFNETDFENGLVGFNDLSNIKFICHIKNIENIKSLIEETEKYICIVEPINLWIIEK